MSEIETRFKDVSKSIAQDPKIKKALNEGKPHIASDRIMTVHFSQMTLSDLIRECLRDSDEREIRMILEEQVNENDK